MSKLKRLLELSDLLEQHEKLLAEVEKQSELSPAAEKAVQDLAKALKQEEEAQADLAKRIHFKTEAEDRMARMQRYNPGTSFLGYQCPARKRIEAAKLAIREHDRALKLCEKRRELIKGRANALYKKFRKLRPNTDALELRLSRLRQRQVAMMRDIRETDIDEMVMGNRLTEHDAMRLRQALRSRQHHELER